MDVVQLTPSSDVGIQVGSFSGGTNGTIALLITFAKIAVTLIQILTQLGFCLELTWPEPFHELINL